MLEVVPSAVVIFKQCCDCWRLDDVIVDKWLAGLLSSKFPETGDKSWISSCRFDFSFDVSYNCANPSDILNQFSHVAFLNVGVLSKISLENTTQTKPGLVMCSLELETNHVALDKKKNKFLRKQEKEPFIVISWEIKARNLRHDSCLRPTSSRALLACWFGFTHWNKLLIFVQLLYKDERWKRLLPFHCINLFGDVSPKTSADSGAAFICWGPATGCWRL